MDPEMQDLAERFHKAVVVNVVDRLYPDLKTTKTKDEIIEEITKSFKNFQNQCPKKNPELSRKEVQDLCKQKGIKNCRRKTSELLKDLEALEISENNEPTNLTVEDYSPETDEEVESSST